MYRMVLNGIRLKEIMDTDLACEYRAIMSLIRKDMKLIFGEHKDGWLPCEVLSRKDGEVDSRWQLMIPDTANPEDPLGYLGEFMRRRPVEGDRKKLVIPKKKVDKQRGSQLLLL